MPEAQRSLYISDLENKIEIAVNSLTTLRNDISVNVYPISRGYIVNKLNEIIKDLSFLNEGE